MPASTLVRDNQTGNKASGGVHDPSNKPGWSRSLAAICLYIVVQIILVIVPPMTTRTSYLAGTIEKHKHLESVKSPRIILLGGSNVAFGFDSEYVEKELGLPVLNMALHGGLGLRYAINEVLPEIRKSDIVIVSPEYPQYDDPDGDLTLLELLYVYPRGIRFLTTENLAAFPKAYGQLSKFKVDWWKQLGCVNPKFNPIYNRSAFNKNGDVISHLDRVTPPHKYFPEKCSMLSPPTPNCGAVRALKRLEEVCRERGANVFYSYPPIVSTYFHQLDNFANIESLDKLLRKQAGINVLGKPDRYLFDASLFFDTTDHLAKPARLERSKRLVEDIRNEPKAIHLIEIESEATTQAL